MCDPTHRHRRPRLGPPTARPPPPPHRRISASSRSSSVLCHPSLLHLPKARLGARCQWPKLTIATPAGLVSKRQTGGGVFVASVVVSIQDSPAVHAVPTAYELRSMGVQNGCRCRVGWCHHRARVVGDGAANAGAGMGGHRWRRCRIRGEQPCVSRSPGGDCTASIPARVNRVASLQADTAEPRQSKRCRRPRPRPSDEAGDDTSRRSRGGDNRATAHGSDIRSVG